MNARIRLTIVALIVAACGGTQPLTGTVTLNDSDVAFSATSCSGTGGYSDIEPGLGVTVRDQDGKTIGNSELVYDPTGSNSTKCRYTFTVPLSGVASFYELDIGRRGELTYSFDELVAEAWSIDLTLGN